MDSIKPSISLRFLGAILALGLLTTLPAPLAWAIDPCCGIVSIDKATGIVTLRDSRTGQLEKVKMDPAQLAALKVGQPVDRSIGTLVPAR